jgi:esterase/lipase superfamily enzyme
MNREYYKWFSTSLQRKMELLIFGHAGRVVLLFPTRMARFYDYENWKVIEALEPQINAGEMQVYCVDSIDAESFYNKNISPAERIKRHLQYEAYIIEEVIPFMYVKNGTTIFEVAGCSMGAFHAVNLAFKHPLLFKKVIGMSGRYDLTISMQHFNDLFDGYRNEDIYYNMPLQYVPNITDEGTLNAIRNIEVVLVIGQVDPFLPNDQEFSGKLREKGINHQFYIWDGYAHKPKYWSKMVQLYL